MSKFTAKTPTSSVETITPEKASEYLKNNSCNRPLSKHIVANYANQIRAGGWRVNGEAIIFSDTGRLLNGQHRLQAVINAGLPIETYVTRGIPDEAFATLDTGKGRTLTDLLRMQGITGLAATVAGAIQTSYNVSRRGSAGMRHKERLSNEVLLTFFEDNPGLTDSYSKIFTLEFVRALGLPSVFIAFHYHIGQLYGEDVANEFFDVFNSGENLSAGNPLLALRNRLMDMKIKSKGRSSLSRERAQVFWLMARAFNAYILGEELLHMVYPKEPIDVIDPASKKLAKAMQ